MRTLVAQILGLYLAVTLASTALAKVRTFNVGATALASSLRGSLASGRALLLMVCFTELLLAVCIALGITDLIVAGSAATMFAAFGCYRGMIALRTGNVSCTCNGHFDKASATVPRVIGLIASNVLLALIALAWWILRREGADASHLSPLPLLGLGAPVIVWVIGHTRQRWRTRISDIAC